MRLRPSSTTVVLLAALPLLVCGCGLGGGSSPSTTITTTGTLDQSLLPHVRRHAGRRRHPGSRAKPASPGAVASVRRAAGVSQAQPGARVIATLTTRVPGDAAPARARFSAFDAIGQDAVSARLDVPVALRDGAMRTFAVRVIVRGGTMYLRPPAAFAGLVAPRRSWWALPLAQLPAFEASARLGPLVRAAAAINVPGAYLAYLGSLAGGMHELGRATVGGIETKHYKALVGAAEAVRLVPEPLRATLSPALEAAAAGSRPVVVAVDAWIDASRLVRRLHLSLSSRSRSGQPIELSMQADFVSYLGVPAPAAPPAAQTAHPPA